MKEEKTKLLGNKLNRENYNLFNDFNIKLKEPIHILNNHKDYIKCLSILKDGRLVSGSNDKSIIIYNKKTYQPDLIIKEHNGYINYLTTISSGILASCSDDETIKLFNIKDNKYEILHTLNYHTNSVFKIIELKNKSLVSCSFDKSIIFYKKDNNNNYIKDYKLNLNNYCYSVFQINDNEICYSESVISIYFYDLFHKQIISKLNNIILNGYINEGFIMINKELLLIPGINRVSILNIKNYKLIRIIDFPNFNSIIGICMLNKNILLTGDEKGIIREWKIEGDNLILISLKENAHSDLIYSLINIGDGHIASGSFDNSIKIW